MNKFLKFIIVLILFLSYSLEINAQIPPLKNGEIPKDLLIKYESQSVGPMNNMHYKFSVQAKGNITYEIFSRPFEKLFSSAKKKKLSKDNLRQLISEFEKAEFFNLDKDYSFEKGNCGNGLPIPHRTNVIISVRINGKTKEVSSISGCIGEPGSDLEKFDNLGKKISQIILN